MHIGIHILEFTPNKVKKRGDDTAHAREQAQDRIFDHVMSSKEKFDSAGEFTMFPHRQTTL